MTCPRCKAKHCGCTCDCGLSEDRHFRCCRCETCYSEHLETLVAAREAAEREKAVR